jgi:signal transduction histidine kinase
MSDGDLPAGEGDPHLPLVYRLARHHYTPAQLVWMDMAAVILLSLFCVFFIPRHPTVSGPAWDAAGWVGYATTSAAILFRRGFPWLTLALVFAVTVVGSVVRAPLPTIFYLVMVLYSVVVVSSRRTSLLVRTIVSAGVAAAIACGGGPLVEAAIGAVALMGVGWLAGESVRASRIYARHEKQRAAEQAASVEADGVEQVRRAVSDERVEIARELHDIVAHAMSVIAVRSGVARMVIDSQPEQAREALSIIETTTRRSLQEMRLLVGFCATPTIIVQNSGRLLACETLNASSPTWQWPGSRSPWRSTVWFAACHPRPIYRHIE